MADWTIHATVYRDGVAVAWGYGGASTHRGAVDDLAACLANDIPTPDLETGEQ